MKRKKELIYILISVSVGFLLYNYIFTDYGYGMMSNHYGYFSNYSSPTFYLIMGLMIISYSTIIIGIVVLLSMKAKPVNSSLRILDERLSKGEISIEEYKKIERVINSK